mmetsp:Transcript_32070/g.73719  ORF Transcript_32070/g.73719 Transcript_32070/m.73719 type:complete len:277 (+) Transcript_32070:1046-1876(+)
MQTHADPFTLVQVQPTPILFQNGFIFVGVAQRRAQIVSIHIEIRSKMDWSGEVSIKRVRVSRHRARELVRAGENQELCQTREMFCFTPDRNAVDERADVDAPQLQEPNNNNNKIGDVEFIHPPVRTSLRLPSLPAPDTNDPATTGPAAASFGGPNQNQYPQTVLRPCIRLRPCIPPGPFFSQRTEATCDRELEELFASEDAPLFPLSRSTMPQPFRQLPRCKDISKPVPRHLHKSPIHQSSHTPALVPSKHHPTLSACPSSAFQPAGNQAASMVLG